MKRLFYFVWGLLCFPALAQAQIELVPLSENPVIIRHLQKQAPVGKRQTALQKMDCANFQKPGVFYVRAGNTLSIKIQIDTAGLGAGTFSCVNCAGAANGKAQVSNDTLFFVARNDVNAGQDQIQIDFCNNANDCRTRTYTIVTRRAGRTYNPAFPIPVARGGKDTLVAIVSNLPGRRAVCGEVIDCNDPYNGGGQEEVLFLNNNPAEGRFTYQASRFPGIDTVCMVLCDSFAVCDTFKFAFRISGDTLQIPFMDDFSYFGPYPRSSHWLDLDVFVNNDMADTPPSWGVATFDGLNSSGTAHGGGFGPADALTSNFVNLNAVDADVHLSFWLQRRGFADRPEVQDSFILEFKNRNGQWQQMQRWAGAPSNEPNTAASPFRFYSVLVPTEFKHAGFQFRFRNLSDRTGILDTWHLDYVRLDRNAQDSVFNDIAFTRFPNSILKKYSSMPWYQFKGFEEKELYDSVNVHIRNHAVETLNASPSSVRLFEINSNTEIYKKTLFNATANENESAIPNGISLFRRYYIKGDTTGFPDFWPEYLGKMKNDFFDLFERLDFRLEYILENGSQSNTPGYKLSVDQNDSVRRFTTFDNYFAYDDGTAETGLIAQQGVEVAMRYVVNKPDTLRAVQFQFPRTTVDISDQRFTLKIWKGQLDNTPDYEAFAQQAYYADIFFDTLQGFTTYPLMNANGELTPLALAAGDTIFIGWQQETACIGTRCIPVGFDRNSLNGTAQSFNRIGSQWQPFPPTLSGSLMIRAVVGSETPPATSTDDVQKPPRNFALYPNPTSAILNITPTEGWYEDFQYLLFNSTGQLLQQGQLMPQLQVQDLPAGMYFIKIADHQSNQVWNERFIIAR